MVRAGSTWWHGSGGGRCQFGYGFVGGDTLEEPVEVGAGEAPVERGGGGVVAILEGEYPCGEGVEIGQVVGVSTLRCSMEKKISAWFNQDACTGRCTSWAVGHALLIRVTEARPRCEDPLSTIQNTRSALA